MLGNGIPSRVDRHTADATAAPPDCVRIEPGQPAFPIQLPPLAERREDIPGIAKTLVQRISADQQLRLTEAAVQLLREHDYRGNIRELRNILARAVVLTDTNLIDDRVIADALAVDGDAAESSTLPAVDLKTAEINYLNQLMETYNDRDKVAEIAGISMRSLYRKMAQSK